MREYKHINGMEFSHRLRTLVSESGKLAKDIAEETGTQAPTLSRYCHKANDPAIDLVYRFAQYFNVSMDWILGVCDDRLSVLSEDQKEFLNLYSVASEQDREVVRAILKRYEI